MKSFMEECKGSIMNVPGCDGTINDHPKSEAQKHQTKKNLTWLGGGGTIDPVGLFVAHTLRSLAGWPRELLLIALDLVDSNKAEMWK